MPHVKGHVQNSFLRVNSPFPKKVGVLRPIYTGDQKVPNWKGELVEIPKMPNGIVDYPILFVNDLENPLVYGQEVCFLLNHITTIGNKHFIMAGQLLDAKFHKTAEAELSSYKSGVASSLGSNGKTLKDQEDAYRKQNSYNIIFKNNGIKEDDSNRVIEWLIQNAISFDDMNLGTN